MTYNQKAYGIISLLVLLFWSIITSGLWLIFT